ncbi:MAG: hypothetical protein AAFU56_04480, partial [Pseudomonadota bacterium]
MHTGMSKGMTLKKTKFSTFRRFVFAGALALGMSTGLIASGGAPTLGLGMAVQAAPASVADLADRLIGAVVNISTSQKVTGGERRAPRPRVPEGSPFQDFFDVEMLTTAPIKRSARSATDAGAA